MKLIIILMTAFLMQVSASSFAQRITIKNESITLKRAFVEIRKQTGYIVLYKSDLLNKTKPVKLDLINIPLEEALRVMLDGQNLEFSIKDKSVVVKEKPSIIQKVVDYFSKIDVKGRVVDENGNAMAGASIAIKGTDSKTVTNGNGEFSFTNVEEKGILVISFIGYEVKEISAKSDLGNITMSVSTGKLDEVSVTVSTGYQTLPKERATGSFVQIDNELLNRRISTNILERLEDVTPGLIFNKGKAGSSISIRGQNTIYGNSNPLIVIDNFPYEGDINNINPNDVESITVLKDAAAASIWGSRAGNGVIVITTKKGKFNQAPKISFNSNLTVGQKPDLFYQSRMSSEDYIEIEKKLFGQNYYNQFETSNLNPALTPVVELLILKRDNPSMATQIDAQIEALKGNNIRNDFERYFYQNSSKQQYNLNIAGGGEQHRYYVSAGHDQNKDNLINNGYNRLTLNAGNNFSFFKDRLKASANIYFTQGNTANNNPGTSFLGMNSGSSVSMYPYAKLADNDGNSLILTQDYRVKFLQAAQNAGLVDWTYKPIDEIYFADNTNRSKDYRINTSLKYDVLPSLSIESLYQYGFTNNLRRNLRSEQSYFTRNLINRFTQVISPGVLSYPVPKGGILDLSNTDTESQNVRLQLNYSKKWNDQHELNAIGGYELREIHTMGTSNRMYGYDNENATVSKVDYIGSYRQYPNPGSSVTIPFSDASTELTDRYLSYYSNVAYSYKKRYTLSASVRLDRSNLFGVNTNQQGVPLYSFGLAWIVNQEKFYKLDWLPSLKIRTTYGYNGNVNKSLSAYTTARYSSGNAINQTFATIINPPNPDLRWERVKMFNVGIDFSTRANRLSGSIEPYYKKGIDLIGDIAYVPSTGITIFRGNTANTEGHGLDISINSINIAGNFKWTTNFFFSYVNDKVVNYDLKQGAAFYTQFGETNVYPLEGKPFYALYSYKSAGLDSKNGDPRGYFNGEISKDYSAILTAATPDNLVYHGSARPSTFGSLRNSLSYRQITISANISYRFGYFFRMPTISYSNILTGQGYIYGSYSSRWQKEGDELFTNVPSMPSAINGNRDTFYNYSEVTVEKADNIRLQDISLAYTFKNPKQLLPFDHIQLYGYVNNIGILWKATSSDLDPDYSNAEFRPVRTVGLGLKIDF